MPKAISERDRLWERLQRLDPSDQLDILNRLREKLSDVEPGETRADRIAQTRVAALDAMAAVADHLKLPPDRAPTVGQFNDAARELGLGMEASRIRRAFGRWRAAQREFLKRRAEPEKFSAASPTGLRAEEQYVEDVREWLLSEPQDTSESAYDAHVQALNAAGGERRRVASRNIMVLLGIRWNAVLAVARGQQTIGEAVKARVRRQRGAANPLGLVDLGEIAGMLGATSRNAAWVADRPGFPASVAKVGLNRVWYGDDVRAHLAGRKTPKRTEGELQDQVLSAGDVATRLHFRGQRFNHSLVRKRWGVVPPPSGQVGRLNYWLPDDVARWQREHQRRD